MRRTMDFGGSGSRTVLARVLVAILLIGAGFAIGRWSAPDSVPPSESDGEPDSVVESVVGPRALRAGVPVGYAPSEEGAMQAALNYVRALTPSPGETKEDYEGKLRAIASSEWGEELETTIDSWSEGEGEVAALRVKLNDFSSQRAEVALWVAGVVNPRNGSPGAVWGRSFISLVWEQGDWKVAAEDGDEGPWPAPLSGPSSSEEIARLLKGYRSFDYEPASQR